MESKKTTPKTNKSWRFHDAPPKSDETSGSGAGSAPPLSLVVAELFATLRADSSTRAAALKILAAIEEKHRPPICPTCRRLHDKINPYQDPQKEEPTQ